MNPGLDVVIRLEDASDLFRLDQALFTVLGQNTGFPVHVHLMLARFQAEDLRRLRQITAPLRDMSDATICVHNWQLRKPLDLAVPFLNWAIEVSASRYFTTLEVSDILGAGAYATLSDRLQSGGDAIVAAPLMPQRVDWWGDCLIPAAAPDRCAAEKPDTPAVLFMLDRSRVALRDLVFTAAEPGGEIAGFIERIGALHQTGVSLRRKPIGVRQVPN